MSKFSSPFLVSHTTRQRSGARLLSALGALLLCASPAPAGMVAYWNFNEGSGSTASDSTANHNNGTLGGSSGSPTWVTGHTGVTGDKAVQITGGTSYVSVLSSASLATVTTNFTIAAWVFESSATNYGHIFVTTTDFSNRNWLLQTDNGGDSAYVWSTTNGNWQKGLGWQIPDGTWHHVAITYDGSNMRSYLDATLKNTQAIGGSASFPAFGTLYLGGWLAYNSSFGGSLDDVVIFNSVEDVSLIKNGTHPAMLPAPLWTGGGTPNGSGQLLWTHAANWGGSTMAADKVLAFATSTGLTTNSNDFSSNTKFAGITFAAGSGAFTLGGNTLNLTGDVVNNSANAQTLSNNIVLDGGTRTFNAAAGNLVINNGISEVQAGRGLTKTGANTLALAGSSTYTGATLINAGALRLNGGSLGNTAVTVAGSSSCLAGDGSVAGAVTAQTSGHLAPGINATTLGTLALGNGLTLNVANLDIKAGAPGTSDVVAVTGNLVLTGNTQVNLTQQLAGFGLGDYVILTYTGTLTGSASQILAPPQDANFSYSIQTTGNQIKLHVAPASAKTYYVSQSAGLDTNAGLTSGAPWKTLAQASSVTLNAGDAILLKCGDTWNEELQPKGNGSAGNPIYIGSYGAGNKPLIDRGDVAQKNGIRLIDQGGYKIVGLEFSHCETGIFGEYHTGNPTRKFVWIEDCYFHDSLRYGGYGDYYNAKNISVGISFWSFESWSSNVSLQDITVKNCVFRRLASGIWTNSPDNFDYNADNFYNFANLTVSGCLFEEGYQWQLGLRGIAGGQITNCVTHDIGRLNNFVAFNGVAGAMMYRLKDFTFTDSEWGFVSRGGGSGDGEAFDLEGNNSNMTFTNCLFHDADGPCIMLYQGAAHGNVGNQFTNCVWNGKSPRSNLGREEIFNASPGANTAQFTSFRIYLSAGEARCNNETSFTFINGLTRNLSDAGTGTNLALAATAVAASSQQAGYEASKAKDGNASTIWRPASAANEWLELTFASPTLVNEFRLREDSASLIDRYTIQYWDSTSSSWLGCFNGRTMGSNFIAPIVSRTTTKVRLLVTSTTSGTPGIAEFEAYYVDIPPPPTTVYWRVGDAVWDINTTANWKNAGGTAINYVDGDIVFLDDTASGAAPITITQNTSVAPFSVTVDATKNYVLTGSGGIGGGASLTKSNSGTLALAGTNSYTGSTTLNGGTLSFGSGGSLPVGSLGVFAGGTLEFSGSGAAGTYSLSAAGDAAYLVNATQAAGTLTLTRAHGNYNGMTKGGPGTVILANNYQDSGSLTVTQGTAILAGNSSNPVNWSTTNGMDVKSGATLKLGNAQVGQIYYDGGFTMESGATFDLNGQDGAELPAINGSGTLTNSVAATTGTARFKINGSKTFSGTIADGAGKVAIVMTGGGGTWTLSGINTYTGNTTVNSGSLVLADNAGLKFVVGNASNNSISGGATATFSGDFTIDTSAVTVATGTWTLVNAATLTESFTSTFSVVGFTPNVDGVTWTRVDGTKTWTFTETNGKLVLSASPGQPFDNWVNSVDYNTPALTAAQKLPDADPDNDGVTNLSEFAFHGNPVSGSDSGYHCAATEDTNADTLKELTLTLAVRNASGSPVFSGSPSPTATVDGITYTIEGSLGLTFPGSVVTETPPPVGLPALPGGWEYRRFRLDASSGLAGTGFIRAKVTK